MKIGVRGLIFGGTVRILDEKGLQGGVALFTKKYGKRNLDNYYPRKDTAVEVTLLERRMFRPLRGGKNSR